MHRTAHAESADLKLPPELWQRLMHAAEVYSVTEFENYLGEVEALGERGSELAVRLRELSHNVQFEEILKILNHAKAAS